MVREAAPAPRRYSVKFNIGPQEPTSCILLWEGDAQDAGVAERKAMRYLRECLRTGQVEAQTAMRMR